MMDEKFSLRLTDHLLYFWQIIEILVERNLLYNKKSRY